MKRIIWLGFGLLVYGRAAQFAEAQGTVKEPRIALVELFTSEGCSSCPPADAVLRKLDGMTVGDGVLVIGLSEHVTYWNNLGWRDPFSQQMLTERQNEYGTRFRLGEIYTPQVVVNGEREVLGSDEGAIVRAVKETGVGMGLRVVSAVRDESGVKVGVELSGDVPKDAEMIAVIAQDKATTEVKRGENGGRTLTHVSVVLNMVRLGRVGAGRSFEVPVPAEVDGARHVVVFVQEARMGRVVAVGAKAF